MSTISLRLPDSLHESVRKLAKEDNISINQFVATALAEKMSALITEEYLMERAARGRKKKFKSVLTKIKNIEPGENDKLSQ
ncbi:MAG: toxin-antitoxin system HicB family antitoxin [Deltaproteobacteria bacterium]|nr:MAG: toxin-antitoxin system HicB family antitoxin [Deltaproteobacteria bacterium]